MRIGEIAIFGPERENKYDFIRAVCRRIELQNDAMIFGRLPVNNQLALHLYGLCISEQRLNVSWDLVSKKLLGYVVIFNWDDPKSYVEAKSTIAFLSQRYDMPLVVAANLENAPSSIPQQLLNHNLDLAPQCDFTFFRVKEGASVKRVLVKLLDSIIERV